MDRGKKISDRLEKWGVKQWSQETVDLGILTVPNWFFWPIFLGMFIAIIVLVMISKSECYSSFENKDLYGNSIRFLQRRDDTGSIPTSLEERTSK